MPDPTLRLLRKPDSGTSGKGAPRSTWLRSEGLVRNTARNRAPPLSPCCSSGSRVKQSSQRAGCGKRAHSVTRSHSSWPRHAARHSCGNRSSIQAHAQPLSYRGLCNPSQAACLQHFSRQVLWKVAAPPPAAAACAVHAAGAAAGVHGCASRWGGAVCAAAAAATPAGWRRRPGSIHGCASCPAACCAPAAGSAPAAAATVCAARWRRRRCEATMRCGAAVSAIGIAAGTAGSAGSAVPAPAAAAAAAGSAAAGKVGRGRGRAITVLRRAIAVLLRAVAVLLALHI